MERSSHAQEVLGLHLPSSRCWPALGVRQCTPLSGACRQRARQPRALIPPPVASGVGQAAVSRFERLPALGLGDSKGETRRRLTRFCGMADELDAALDEVVNYFSDLPV